MAGVSLVVVSIAGGLIPATGGGPVDAAVSNVGGACGFHLGAPLATGAAGSAGFEFLVYPANPFQICQASVFCADTTLARARRQSRHEEAK